MESKMDTPVLVLRKCSGRRPVVLSSELYEHLRVPTVGTTPPQGHDTYRLLSTHLILLLVLIRLAVIS